MWENITSATLSFIGKIEDQTQPDPEYSASVLFVCSMIIAEKIEKLAFEVSEIFDVQVMKELSLLTIRHYNKDVFEKLTLGKTILLRQQTTETIQLLMQ